MIVIIEGSDLVGKTTLANALRAKHQWPIVRLRWDLRGDPEIETTAMAKATIALLAATQPNVIFDRIYFSWWAYSQVLGYESGYMPALISKYSVVKDTKLILLTASQECLAERFQRCPDIYFTLDVIQAANQRFPSLLPLLPAQLPRLHLDTTEVIAEDVLAKAEAFLASSA